MLKHQEQQHSRNTLPMMHSLTSVVPRCWHGHTLFSTSHAQDTSLAPSPVHSCMHAGLSGFLRGGSASCTSPAPKLFFRDVLLLLLALENVFIHVCSSHLAFFACMRRGPSQCGNQALKPVKTKEAHVAVSMLSALTLLFSKMSMRSCCACMCG